MACSRPDAGADPERDRHNIAAHYDLGNDFFAAFLDQTMTYSSAIFDPADATLAEASTRKLDRMCRLLQLAPEDRVIEIGSGWGSFATHAASRYDARVTTTTISAEQYEWARKRVAADGLSHRVQVLNEDYRDLVGTYDKLASIEMIEAVDWRELDTFVGTCTRLLEPDGLMGLQAIVIPGHRWAGTKDRPDFIKTHIFPGGCLPSIESLSASISRVSDLTLIELHDYGLHYAETIRRWRANLEAHHDELAAMGLDERFAAAVAVLPLLLRGRVRRARHQRGPVPAGPPGPPAARALPSLGAGAARLGQTGGDGSLEPTAPTGRHAALGGALPALRRRMAPPGAWLGRRRCTTCAGWPSGACPGACSTTSTARPRTSWPRRATTRPSGA